MTDKPIFFTADSIRAILEGRKFQTRRVLNPQPVVCPLNQRYLDWKGATYDVGALVRECRYQPGTTLWVKESFWIVDCPFYYGPRLLYEDEFKLYSKCTEREYEEERAWAHLQGREFWSARSCDMNFGHHPSPHMPRWASRLSLTVTATKIERLQDISEADAVAEGCKPMMVSLTSCDCGRTIQQTDSAIATYVETWDRINGGKHPWASNPFVEAVTFEVKEQR